MTPTSVDPKRIYKAAVPESIRAAAIAGIGVSVPEKVLTNMDLEKMVDTSNEWIVERTGIMERRVGNEKTATSDLCIDAAKKALKEAEVSPEELEMLIVCTVTPDYTVPSTACIVQAALGAKNACAFDILAGCTGFMYGLSVGSQFVAGGKHDKVLVIGADMLSKIVDWKDRSTCVLFGDGAGAVLLRPSKREGFGLLDLELRADGTGADLLKVEAGGTRNPTSGQTVLDRKHYLRMAGRPVFKFAVHAILDGVRTLLTNRNLTIDDIDCFIFHQANMRIIENAVKQLNIPMEKVFTNVQRYGNTSSASIPLALEEARREKKFKQGSYVIMIGFGAGLTWGSALMRW